MEIQVLSQLDAERYHPVTEHEILISITGPDQPLSNIRTYLYMDILRLQFDDDTMERDYGYRLSQLFSTEQAEEVLAFVDRYRDTATRLTVHCAAGISRSAGLAIGISDLYGDREQTLDLIKKKPNYNRYVTNTLLKTAMGY